ncbi:unnamed protein product [Cyprideis torosa]|uniref:DNA repair protein SWI5 homolog n=1 Tax=Cyprideis torosa TaxID=163714 RepID=A0A7R8WEX8_9CRUS|nr:unnamed protein product [Cyprideis torosa]CAG0894814.1 unnamed protein product [Cyprideis torosa]
MLKNAAFKPPFRRQDLSPGSSQPGASSNSTAPEGSERHSHEYWRLKTTLQQLQSEIAAFEDKGQAVDDGQRKTQLELLHEYNEVKDAAQLVLGKLAEIKGISLKEIHLEFGLDPMEK